MYNPFTLKNKTIFITGASSGIGKAAAIECSKLGAKVIISGRDESRLKQTISSLEGNDHSFNIADLTNELEINKLIDELPPVDGIIHSAGIIKTIPFQFINNKTLSSILDINFNAPVKISQQLIKKKKVKREASIVFISSISGVLCSSPGGSLYSASKGAINGLIKGMAIDLAPKGIRVNSILPGMINTSIFDEGIITKEQFQEDMKRYPLKRYGEPEEVAYAAIYLLSDAAKWVTGSDLLIDGGFTLQ